MSMSQYGVNGYRITIRGALKAYQKDVTYKIGKILNEENTPYIDINIMTPMTSGTGIHGLAHLQIDANGDINLTPLQSECNWLYADIFFFK